MRLEQIVFALNVRQEAETRSEELAAFAFMEWLGSLDGRSGFLEQAQVARSRLGDPDALALRAFVALLERSIADPFDILPLAMPKQVRRGGRSRRRLTI